MRLPGRGTCALGSRAASTGRVGTLAGDGCPPGTVGATGAGTRCARSSAPGTAPAGPAASCRWSRPLAAGGNGVPQEPQQEVQGALIPGLQAPRRCPSESTQLSTALWRQVADHVEFVWRLPISAPGWLPAGISVDVGATGPLGLLTWRRHRSRAGAARAMSPSRVSSPPLHGVARAAQQRSSTLPKSTALARGVRRGRGRHHEASGLACRLRLMQVVPR